MANCSGKCASSNFPRRGANAQDWVTVQNRRLHSQKWAEAAAGLAAPRCQGHLWRRGASVLAAQRRRTSPARPWTRWAAAWDAGRRDWGRSGAWCLLHGRCARACACPARRRHHPLFRRGRHLPVVPCLPRRPARTRRHRIKRPDLCPLLCRLWDSRVRVCATCRVEAAAQLFHQRLARHLHSPQGGQPGTRQSDQTLRPPRRAP